MICWLFDTLVWSGVLIAVVLVLRRPVARVFGPQMAYALWLLPLLRLVMPPLVLPTAAPPRLPRTETVTDVVTLTFAEPAAIPPLTLPWELLLSAAWLGGAVLFLIARAIEYRQMRARLLARASIVDRREGVRIVETPAVDAPVAFGVRDKVIAVPPRFLITGTLAERGLAIEHELAHHRGHDLLANILAQGVLALHWFNPLAWTAWSAMRRDQEAACDARVMAGRDLETRAAYARVIAGFASGQRLVSRAALAAPMACPVLGDKSIIHRLRSLTMSDISPRRRRAARWLFGAGTALALPLTATVVHAGGEEREPLAATKPAPRVEKRFVIVDAPEGAQPDDPTLHTRTVVRDGTTVVLKTRKPVTEAEADARIAKAKADLRATEAMESTEELRLPEIAGAQEGSRTAKAPHQRREIRKFVIHDGASDKGIVTVVPRKDCGDAGTVADVDVRRDGGTDGRKMQHRARMLLCGPVHRDKAETLAMVRSARDNLAANRSLSDEIRADVLKQLDETIARMENTH